MSGRDLSLSPVLAPCDGTSHSHSCRPTASSTCSVAKPMPGSLMANLHLPLWASAWAPRRVTGSRWRMDGGGRMPTASPAQRGQVPTTCCVAPGVWAGTRRRTAVSTRCHRRALEAAGSVSPRAHPTHMWQWSCVPVTSVTGWVW